MRAARLQELEEMALRLLALARKLARGQQRHDVVREIGRFRVDRCSEKPRFAPDTPKGRRQGGSDCHSGQIKRVFNDMKYCGIEYSVVQGIGRHVWKWSVSLDTGVSVGGRTAVKSEAVAEAERAIDRALAPKKLRFVPPKTER
jgi:hypothetical protein